MQKNRAYIELGGNQGDRLALIMQAKNKIKEYGGKIIAESSVYETPPWGFESKSNFYNQVILIETYLNSKNLIKKLQSTEKILGRKREKNQYCSRTMDIDILFFNDLIIKDEDLIIPHPRMHLRNFVLMPMNEIAPEFIHPEFQKSMQFLLKTCPDNSECKIIQ